MPYNLRDPLIPTTDLDRFIATLPMATPDQAPAPALPLGITDEDLDLERLQLGGRAPIPFGGVAPRQTPVPSLDAYSTQRAPIPPTAPPAPPAPPSPAPAPPSQQGALKGKKGGAMDSVGWTGAATLPPGGGVARPDLVVPPRVAPVTPGAGANRGPSAQEIRNLLGFSWGKGVKTHKDAQGLDRPVTSSPSVTLSEGNYVPMDNRAAAVVPSTVLPTGAAGGRTTAPAHAQRYSGVQMPGREAEGGGSFFGPVVTPQDQLAETVDKVNQESAQRALERAHTGPAAPPTAGELLEDQRRLAQQQALSSEKNQKLTMLDAAYVSGQYTPETYQAARDEIVRAYAMERGVDPRYFQLR